MANLHSLPPYTFGIEVECFGVPHQIMTYVLRKHGFEVANLFDRSEQGNAAWQQAANGRYGSNSWVIGADGSIRGEHGMEIKSPILSGPAGIKTVRTLIRLLKKTGAKVNESTGLHVHVGVRNAPAGHEHDFTTIYEVVRRYSEHGEDIEAMMRQDRRSGANTFCQNVKRVLDVLTPMKDAPVLAPEPFPGNWAMIPAADRAHYERHGWGNHRWSDGRYHTYPEPIRPEQMRDFSYIGSYGTHYDAVSIAALRKYGTIEFRQHHGSLEAQEVCSWVMFVLNHVEQSRVAARRNTMPVIRRRGRPEGAFAGLPTNVRTHFKKQQQRFAGSSSATGQRTTSGAPAAVIDAARRVAASQMATIR